MSIRRTSRSKGAAAEFEYSSGDILYAGQAAAGSATSAAVWSVRKFTYTSGNLTKIEWADGNENEDNVWDDRASLSYS